jgi:fructose-bisphosphate aldolase class 1
MNAQGLKDTATALVAGGKGLLAMDESTPTCEWKISKDRANHHEWHTVCG